MKEAETEDVDFDSYESESVQSSENISEAYVEEDNDKDGEYEFDPEDADENELSGSEQNDSNASGEESAFAEDLDDLEDDMELIVEAKKMSSVFEWPVVIEVSLDRKIPVKLKPVEFEPIKDGTVLNISNQLDKPFVNKHKENAAILHCALTKKDEVAILMLEEIHGSVARDDFMQMHDWVCTNRKLDSGFEFTISQLRKIVPEADIHLVCDIYEILNQKMVNIFNSL